MFYALGTVGGLITDGFPRWSFPVALDFFNFAAQALALGLFAFPWWKKSHAAALMIFAGTTTFPLTLGYLLLVGGQSPDLAAYNNLFIVSLFLGPAVFLVGRWSSVVFAAVLLTMMTVAAITGAPLLTQHLWFEVPGVLGVAYLLFRYRGALDGVLTDLQRSINETKLYRERERLATLGELTAGIAHEIKNPLNLVVNFAESSVDLLDEWTRADGPDREYLLHELKSNLVEIRAQGQRGVAIVQSMLAHARSGPREPEAVDVGALAAECLRLSWLTYRDRIRSSVRHRVVGAPGPLWVRGHRADLSRAFLNLCSNAFWAVGTQAKRAGPGYVGEVVVEVSTMKDAVWVVFRDNGIGLDAKTKSQLCNPFFTTKSPGEGTGLGLSLTLEVIEQHHGRLDAAGEPHKGATFTVVLPLVEAP